MVVYSVIDRDSFLQAEEILEYLTMQTCKDRRARILVGNKVDLERSRQVSAKGENYQKDLSPASHFQRGRTWPPCLTASS